MDLLLTICFVNIIIEEVRKRGERGREVSEEGEVKREKGDMPVVFVQLAKRILAHLVYIKESFEVYIYIKTNKIKN